MDLEEIKELAELMKETDLNKIAIREKGFEVVLERGVPLAAAAPVVPLKTETTSEPASQASSSSNEGTFINSPMVGTFYGAPSPDDAAFVKVGDQVTPDTVVCIVEAMKVMNEVKSGVSGRVTELLIDNGEPVEFGTKLFKVEP